MIEELIDHPMIMIGSSDGGAHLLTFCGSDYTTRLLTNFVPGSLTLERAVAKLTSVPAAALGLWDRGLIRPGFAGDLVLFDPARLAVSPVQLVKDFPAGTSRVDKYWSPVGRVDNVYGDRNLVCSCPPIEDYAQAAE